MLIPSEGTQSLPEKREAVPMWSLLLGYAKKSRAKIRLYSKVPDPVVVPILGDDILDKEGICRWITKTSDCRHINTKPLQRPEVGPIGSHVYSYSIYFEGYRYYFAMFEVLCPSDPKNLITIKSLKLDTNDTRSHIHLGSSLGLLH
jgi:hypothetical protein